MSSNGNNNGDSVDREINKFAYSATKKWIFYILFALAAGGGGHSLFSFIAPPRPDPFTGTEGKELERRIDNMESNFQLLEYKFWELSDKLKKIEKKCEKTSKLGCS